MTWRNGRQLSTVATGGKTYSYEYDANGLRTRRTNSDGGYTLYYIVDGLTVGEQQYTASGSIRRTMKYLLDENNSPVGVSVRYPSYSAGTWDNYYFLKNLQGDVTAIYNASGTLQARYTYDPYGNITSVTNASGATIGAGDAHIANYNPFRYRGYLYDADTGFYYLKTRYYDPELGRFINADSYASTGLGIIGCNMFAYCNNNPIIYADTDGELLGLLIAGAAILCAAAVSIVIVYSPPVQTAIRTIADFIGNAIGNLITDTIDNV